MTTKAAFNADEWSVVSSAPSLAALMVIAAERGGTVRESLAAQRMFSETLAGEPGELVREVLTSPSPLEPDQRPRTADDVGATAQGTLRRAIGILERVGTDDEVVEYKRFVYALAEAVARAHKEGGFLGFGGKEISEREQGVLDEIAAIFDERQVG
jgi:hypothetical protein